MTLADRIVRPHHWNKEEGPSLIERAQINLPCLWLSQTREKAQSDDMEIREEPRSRKLERLAFAPFP